MHRNKIPMRSNQPINNRYLDQSPKYREYQGKHLNTQDSVANNYHNDNGKKNYMNSPTQRSPGNKRQRESSISKVE